MKLTRIVVFAAAAATIAVASFASGGQGLRQAGQARHSTTARPQATTE